MPSRSRIQAGKEETYSANAVRRLVIPAILLTLVIALTACGYRRVYYMQSNPRHTPLNEPLIVDESTLHFGVVNENDAFPWQIAIRNVSDSTINIKSSSSFYDCTRIYSSAWTILPETTRWIELTLDLRNDRRRVDDDVVDFSTLIIMRTDQPTPNVKPITVTGKVYSTVVGLPSH